MGRGEGTEVPTYGVKQYIRTVMEINFGYHSYLLGDYGQLV